MFVLSELAGDDGSTKESGSRPIQVQKDEPAILIWEPEFRVMDPHLDSATAHPRFDCLLLSGKAPTPASSIWRVHLPDITELSLRARLAVALRLFAGYCQRRCVDHPAVVAYFDYLWWFVGMDSSTEAFGEWSAAEPPLVGTGLGWEWPEGFADHLAARGVPELEFRPVLCAATEILYTSLFGAANEPASRRFVSKLATLVAPHGVPFPDLKPFAESRWADGQGWGRLVGPQDASTWRNATDAEL